LKRIRKLWRLKEGEVKMKKKEKKKHVLQFEQFEKTNFALLLYFGDPLACISKTIYGA
jgi:hypothetical protein